MDFGIFNLMGSREADKPTAQLFGEVAEQTRLADALGYTIARNLEMTDEFCDILDLAFSRDFFSYNGKHYQMPDTHIPARPVQNPLPIYVAGHTQAMFRAAARHGYRVLTSGRVGGTKLLAE